MIRLPRPASDRNRPRRRASPAASPAADRRASPGPRAVLLVTLPAVLTVAACSGDRGEIPEATRAEVVALGDSAAMRLVRTLGGQLNSELASHGPAGAIEFCAGAAQELTDSVSAALGPGWEVKRTTMKTRNPRNAPDSLEAEVLTALHEADAPGEEPGPRVQRTPQGDYRYYMPLRLGHMCLECHGDRESMDPAVRTLLDTRYPADQATGYAEGDLRGVVRVTVPATAVR